jgi:hypothetical protein
MSSAPNVIRGSVINDEWGREGAVNRVPSDFRGWFARFASDPNGAAMTPRAWQRIARLPAISGGVMRASRNLEVRTQ